MAIVELIEKSELPGHELIDVLGRAEDNAVRAVSDAVRLASHRLTG